MTNLRKLAESIIVTRGELMIMGVGSPSTRRPDGICCLHWSPNYTWSPFLTSWRTPPPPPLSTCCFVFIRPPLHSFSPLFASSPPGFVLHCLLSFSLSFSLQQVGDGSKCEPRGSGTQPFPSCTSSSLHLSFFFCLYSEHLSITQPPETDFFCPLPWGGCYPFYSDTTFLFTMDTLAMTDWSKM